MLRHSKNLIALALGMMAAQAASAFSLLGPLESWQTAALSYGTRYWYSPNVVTYQGFPTVPGNVPYTEPCGTKDRFAGSRLNVPIITYGFDYTFLQYYGIAGMKAVDAAFAILNKLPPVSSTSADLSEFITEGNQQINYTARALSMLDLKSTVLQMMIQHMGLLGETHVWDLLGQGGTCGAAWYDVGLRNFDPVTYNPTTYVNGVNYTFIVKDACSIGTAIADAWEVANDEPGAGISSTSAAVATQEALQLGGFYLGLTRDDVGGLRYLYRQNVYNNETLPTGCYASTNGSFSQFSAATGTNNLVAGWGGIVGGVEKITFVKVAYEDWIGSTFPTNVVHYNLNILTNVQGVNVRQSLPVWRTNLAPDIIFTAANLLNAAASQDLPFTNSMSFLAPPVAPVNGSTAVPNVIIPTNLVILNNVGPIYYSISPGFLQNSGFFMYPYFQFGSFDGSTNAPIVFPQTANLAALVELELTTPPGQIISPFNPVAATNTTAGGGTGGGTVGGGAGGGAGAGAERHAPPAAVKGRAPANSP
jgi:hypothetical protein